jgi:agmatinase
MITIIKIPFDSCIVEKQRRGAAAGPDTILSELKPDKNIKILEVNEKDDFEKMHKETESTADKSYKNKNFVIGLGGDHSVSYGLMKAFAKNHKNAGLIYFDAHLDCDVDFLPATHEDILRAAVNEHIFDGILVVGTRKYAPNELEFVEKEKILFNKQIDKKQILEFCKNFENIYISIDIDVIDPKLAPGTGYPEPQGILPQQLIELLTKLKASGKVKGMDLVEVSPPKDTNNITAKLAARFLLEFLR